MNEIKPISRKGNRKYIVYSILLSLLVSVAIYARNYALADNQATSDEQITTLTSEMLVIEKSMMVRSQEYNENEKIISEKKTRNSELNNQNNEDRKRLNEMKSKKEALLLGK